MIILLAAGGLFTYTQRSRQKPIEYTEVKRQTIVSTISASGTLAGKNIANLHFKTSGKLASLNVAAGDSIQAYQTIASLDSTDQVVALRQAENTLADKQAALDKIVDDIHLFQYGNGGFSNVGTANETMTQRAQRIAADTAKNNAFDALRSAQHALFDTIITSPISGIITKADFLVGQVVTPTDIIAQVIDDRELYFDAEVDESDISKVTLGQKAIVTLNAYPDKKFSGEVAEIKPITKTASSGATVVIVRILLNSTNITFISSLNGQAEIEVERTEATLTIPTDALVDDEFVYVPKDKGFKKKEVKVGISTDREIEVKLGLSENEKVVKNPANLPNK